MHEFVNTYNDKSLISEINKNQLYSVSEAGQLKSALTKKL